MTDRQLIDPLDIEGTIQKVRLELYRDNLEGALEILREAYDTFPVPRYSAEAAKIRGWLGHLQTREAYVAAYERYYRSVKRGPGLQMLDRAFLTLTGRRTRRMVERCARNAEYRLLEHEAIHGGATRVLDAGCGEGRVALTLGARHPGIRVAGLEVSRTNVRIARRLNRYTNVAFHEGLIEEAGDHFHYDTFDLVYSFGVLGERGLRERFGAYPDFVLWKLPGEWRPGRYPEAIVPVEFGSFFVSFMRP